MNKKFLAITITLLAAFGFLLVPGEIKAGSEHNVSGFAWSENIGWISFNNTSGGGAVNYGVNIGSDSVFSGYAWSEHIGWISFNTSELSGCPSGICEAKLNTQTGEVSGWARALAYDGGWDGWIKMRGTTIDGSPYGVSVNAGNGEFSGWAWSDMVIGWISFRGINYGVNFIPSNYPPDQPNIPPEYQPSGVTWLGGCTYVITIPTFHWAYNDRDNVPLGTDPQTQYQIRIRADSTFPIDAQGNPILQPDEFKCGEEVCSAASQSTSFSPVPVNWINWANYNTNYYWTVRVKDSYNNWSKWSDPSLFNTPVHTYPRPNFTHEPETPVAGEEVIFTDESDCYDASNNIYFCQDNTNNRYLWEFGDGNICDSNINPACRGDVTHSYATQGNATTTLSVTDNVGTCATTTKISTKLPLPEWREVPPMIWLKNIFFAFARFFASF